MDIQSLKARLRQLWEQCDLFEPPPGRVPPPPPPAPVAPPKRRHQKRHRQRFAPRQRDAVYIERLIVAYHEYNARHFQGALSPVPIRISGRMKHRLGHYMTASPDGRPGEIAISRRHIRIDSWDEVLHTLLHEMVHQWQDYAGHPIDHGATFRRKAREVGISARATRPAIFPT